MIYQLLCYNTEKGINCVTLTTESQKKKKKKKKIFIKLAANVLLFFCFKKHVNKSTLQYTREEISSYNFYRVFAHWFRVIQKCFVLYFKIINILENNTGIL